MPIHPRHRLPLLLLCVLLGCWQDPPAQPSGEDSLRAAPTPGPPGPAQAVGSLSTPRAALKTFEQACRDGDVVTMRSAMDDSSLQAALTADFLVASNEAALQAEDFRQALRTRFGEAALDSLQIPALHNPLVPPARDYSAWTSVVTGDRATLTGPAGDERFAVLQDGKWRLDMSFAIEGLSEQDRCGKVGSLAGYAGALDVADVQESADLEAMLFRVRMGLGFGGLHAEMASVRHRMQEWSHRLARDPTEERPAASTAPASGPDLEGKPEPLQVLLKIAAAADGQDSAGLVALCDRSTKQRRDGIEVLLASMRHRAQTSRFLEAVGLRFTVVGENRLGMIPTGVPFVLNDIEDLAADDVQVWMTNATVTTHDARYELQQRDGRWLFNAASLPREDALGYSLPLRARRIDAYTAMLDPLLVEQARSSDALDALMRAKLATDLAKLEPDKPEIQVDPAWAELASVADPDPRQREVAGALQALQEALHSAEPARIRAAVERSTPEQSGACELLLGLNEARLAYEAYTQAVREKFGQSALYQLPLADYPDKLPNFAAHLDNLEILGDSATVTSPAGFALPLRRRDGFWRLDPGCLHGALDGESQARLEAFYACAAGNLDLRAVQQAQTVDALVDDLDLYLAPLAHSTDPGPLRSDLDEYPPPLQALLRLHHAIQRADEHGIRALLLTSSPEGEAAAQRLVDLATLRLRRRRFENAVARKFSWAGAYRFGRAREDIPIADFAVMADYIEAEEAGDRATLLYYGDSAQFVRRDGHWLYDVAEMPLPESWEGRSDAYAKSLRAQLTALSPTLIRSARTIKGLISSYRLLLIGLSAAPD